MEWNLKAACWDLSEVDEANIANMETVEGSNRYKGEFCVDLKLGQVGNSGTSKDGIGVGVSKMRSKRARGLNNGTQTVSCLVDGCHFDLSNCRDYHRRHKVCEVHSKTAQVTIGGHKQRFCQQCSRFHSLEEFDEGKRSCRKRLDGHNRRRRKPQPEPLTRSPTFFSNYHHQATQLLPFSTSTTWADVRLHSHHHMHMHLLDKHDLFLGSSPTAYKEADQSPHLPGPDSSVGQAQMFLRTGPYSETDGLRCKITSSVHDNTSRALSLLSSPQPHNPGMPLMQPLGLSLHENTMGSVDPVLVPNDHSPSMYDLASNGSQGNEASPLFPFQWE